MINQMEKTNIFNSINKQFIKDFFFISIKFRHFLKMFSQYLEIQIMEKDFFVILGQTRLENFSVAKSLTCGLWYRCNTQFINILIRIIGSHKV